MDLIILVVGLALIIGWCAVSCEQGSFSKRMQVVGCLMTIGGLLCLFISVNMRFEASLKNLHTGEAKIVVKYEILEGDTLSAEYLYQQNVQK